MNLKTKEIRGTYLGSLGGGLRVARKASRISRENPSSVVSLGRLGNYPFLKRLSSLGCRAPDLRQPFSTYEAFKKLYSFARFSKDNHLIVVQDIELRMRYEGLEYVLKSLPIGFLNRLISLRLNTVTISEIYERSGVVDHLLKVYDSLKMFRYARDSHQDGTLERLLGNPNSVGEEGLIPSIPFILKLSEVINDFLLDPEVKAAFYVAIFLHDLDKFISQDEHSENSYGLIRTHPQLRETLTEIFSAEQIGIIESVVRYHSTYADTVISKETDILAPYQILLSSPGDQEKKSLLNDLLYILSACDTNTYLPGLSHLANDRMEDLSELHTNIREAIQSGKSTKDIYRSWGKSRFRSWVKKESLALAEAELARIYPSAEEREQFYITLGSLKYVGLISTLRRELKGPKPRVRLLAWLCAHAQEDKKFEFQLQGKEGRWAGDQINIMNGLLGVPLNVEEIDKTLILKRKPDGLIEIIILI